jgi:hypothetical protein
MPWQLALWGRNRVKAIFEKHGKARRNFGLPCFRRFFTLSMVENRIQIQYRKGSACRAPCRDHTLATCRMANSATLGTASLRHIFSPCFFAVPRAGLLRVRYENAAYPYSNHERISLAGLLGYGFVVKSRRSPVTPSLPLRVLIQNPS